MAFFLKSASFGIFPSNTQISKSHQTMPEKLTGMRTVGWRKKNRTQNGHTIDIDIDIHRQTSPKTRKSDILAKNRQDNAIGKLPEAKK